MATYVQGVSPILLTTPLGPDKLLLRAFEGEEHVSNLFHFRLDLVSQDNAVDFTQIVGKSVTIAISLAAGSTQYINGIVGRFVETGGDARFTTYAADVYPWLWLLTMNSDNRIFQNMTTPDIIKQVFSDAGFTDFTDSLTATYSPREYCVQYMESHFHFVSRLMEEEGIFYFFTHDNTSHKLVLADDSSAYAACTGLTTATMQKESHKSEDIVTRCALEQRVTPGQFKYDDYNFVTPATDLLATAAGTDTSRSLYEYPGLYTTSNDGEALTSLRLAAHELPGKTVHGTSYCWAFRPGCKFTLAGHSRADMNAEYLLTAVTHHGDQTTEYSNSFEAIPSSVVFRPPRVTPRPLIHGSQTATVVGKSGEEIWTDQYGRIVVQFHWDQLGQNNEKSSCWIRVSQTWAGKTWGSMFIPRIGQEVIVSFLEGNPDRPIVTGCVYNGQEVVPYTLPDEQTKSTIKSNSSKGGNGFNEMRFEDKAGSEEIFVQAQKDMNVTVLNNQTYTITNNRSVTVQKENESLVVDKGNRTIQVNTGNETHSVKGTRSVTVTGNETHTNQADYTQTVSGNYSLTVSGNLTINVSGSVAVTSGTSTTLKAGTTLDAEAGVSLTAKGSASATVDGGGLLTLKGGLVKIN